MYKWPALRTARIVLAITTATAKTGNITNTAATTTTTNNNNNNNNNENINNNNNNNNNSDVILQSPSTSRSPEPALR